MASSGEGASKMAPMWPGYGEIMTPCQRRRQSLLSYFWKREILLKHEKRNQFTNYRQPRTIWIGNSPIQKWKSPPWTIVFNLCRFATFFMVGKLSSLESFVRRDISLHLDFREYEGNLWLLALLLESVFKSLVPLILQKKSHPLLCAIMPGITQDNGNWPSSLLLFMTLKVNPLLIITTLLCIDVNLDFALFRYWNFA